MVQLTKSDIYSILFELKSAGADVSSLIEDLMNSSDIPLSTKNFIESYNDKVQELFDIFKSKEFYKTLSNKKSNPLEIVIALNSFITHLLIEKRTEPATVIYIIHYYNIGKVLELIQDNLQKLSKDDAQDLTKESENVIKMLTNWNEYISIKNEV